MRSEKEMLNLILGVAEKDERIRAVYMGGSRCNPNAPKDIFQDYDVVYVVRETASFQENPAWIDLFGKRLYMQFPEDNASPANKANCYGWLMQFEDGVRLDLHVQTLKPSIEEFEEDSLCVLLLDKDGNMPQRMEGSDKSYWMQPPSQKEFWDVCTEFWWCVNSLQKGIWREEIPFAQQFLNSVLRQPLLQVLSWKIGMKNNFSCSIGKAGKYLKQRLSSEEYSRYLHTYASGEIEAMWRAGEAMCRLFDESAQEVADFLDLIYDKKEAKASFEMFLHVKNLPKDAAAIF